RFRTIDGAGLGGCQASKLDFAATHLRTGRSQLSPIVARSDSRYVLISADGRVSASRRVSPPLTGRDEALFDLMPFTSQDGGQGLIAVTDAGAFIADVPQGADDAGYVAPLDDAWRPVKIPG